MVSLGDEGFYNKPYGYYNEYTTSNYAFYGAEGDDFEKLMQGKMEASAFEEQPTAPQQPEFSSEEQNSP